MGASVQVCINQALLNQLGSGAEARGRGSVMTKVITKPGVTDLSVVPCTKPTVAFINS